MKNRGTFLGQSDKGSMETVNRNNHSSLEEENENPVALPVHVLFI